MSLKEFNRIKRNIMKWFDGVIDHNNSANELFWDISLIADEIQKEINESYMTNQITRKEIDDLREIFNAQIDNLFEIRIKKE